MNIKKALKSTIRTFYKARFQETPVFVVACGISGLTALYQASYASTNTYGTTRNPLS